MLIASCIALGTGEAQATDVERYVAASSPSSYMHHRIFDARLYPLQDTTTINQADRVVLHIESSDVRTLQLMQKPFYDMDLAGEETSLDKLEKLLMPFVSQITALNLMETYLKEDCFSVIERLVALESLILSDNAFGDKVMPSIGRLSELRHLEIAHTKITDVGVQGLISLRQLEKLDAGCNLLKNSGIKTISGITSLSDLDVRGCEFDEGALPFFLQMPKLKKLNISDNKFKKDVSFETFLAKAKEKGIEVKF